MHSSIYAERYGGRQGDVADPDSMECPPGFMGSPCRRFERGVSLFARWSDSSDPPSNVSTPAFTAERQLVSTGFDHSPRWWHVTVFGRSVIRAADGPTFTPLPPSTIQDAPPISRCRVRVGWGGASGGTVRVLTIGSGVQFEIYSCGVSLTALAPSPCTWGPTSSIIGGAVPTLVSGTVLDEMIGAVIVDSCCGPRGFRAGTLVEVFRLANADPTQTVPIPAGARTLTLSQVAGLALATANFRFNGSNIQPVVLDAAARTATVSVPHHAEDLRIAGAGTEILTLEWGLDL